MGCGVSGGNLFYARMFRNVSATEESSHAHYALVIHARREVASENAWDELDTNLRRSVDYRNISREAQAAHFLSEGQIGFGLLDIVDCLKSGEIPGNHRPVQLFVTGYGIGGAVAHLVAPLIASDGEAGVDKIKVYSFGAPQVADANLREAYTQRIPAGFSYSVGLEGDFLAEAAPTGTVALGKRRRIAPHPVPGRSPGNYMTAIRAGN